MSDITNAAVEAATMTEEIEKIEPAAITIDEVETYDLPSAYDDYEGAPPAAPAPFRIADDDVADREISRITEKVEQAKRRFEADSSFLTGRLADYFMTVPHKKTKTTEKYNLLHGTLTMKIGGAAFTRDDTKLVAWLKENGHGELVKVKEEPAWGDLKKQLEVVGSVAVIKETGEILEGVEVTQAPYTFKVDI